MKDKDYYNQAKDWHMDVHESKHLERNRYFVLCLVFGIIAIGAVFAVAAMAPLKESVPYMVENNTGTGEIRAIKKMGEENFIASSKNIEKHVADYLRYRESFDHHNIRDYFKFVQLMSNDQVAGEYMDYMKNDPRSPYKTFDKEEHTDIYIIDMNHLKSDSVLVHIDATEYRKGSKKPYRKRWAIVMDFAWKGIPKDNKYRYFNPAGFEVTRYRKDQMLINSEVGSS